MKQKEKKTILITGGAGFIGSHFLDNALKNKNWDKVVVIDNLSLDNGQRDKKANINHNLENPNLKFYEVDILNEEQIRKIFEDEKPNIVVHFAAKADTRHAVGNPQLYIDNNITGTLNLLENSKKVEKFIFISSSSVYGNKNKVPFTEDMQTDFSISPYGATKKAGEVLAHTYSHNFNIPIICLRIFNAYGPRMRPNLVLIKWIKSILKNETIEMSGLGKKMGMRKRDYTYVADIVDAVNKSINKNRIKNKFEILNIGNSKPITLKVLLKITEKVLGKKSKVIGRANHNASVENTHASTKKAKKLLGWQPVTPFQEGVKKVLDWYKTTI